MHVHVLRPNRLTRPMDDWPLVGDLVCDCRYKHVRVSARDGDEIVTEDGASFSLANCGIEPVDDQHVHPADAQLAANHERGLPGHPR